MLRFPRFSRSRTPQDPLSYPLFKWSRQDSFTLRDSFSGAIIMGATGSGKTTGSGKIFAKSMLEYGYGGLVLTAKSDEIDTWIEYAKETNRAGDLILFGPGARQSFNFLDYEMAREGNGAGLTMNVVSLLSTVLEVAERNSGSGGTGDESYWVRANRQLMRNVVDLIALAKGRISVPDLYRVVISAPTSSAQVRSDAWKKSSTCFRWLMEADKREMSPSERADFEIVADFWLIEFPNLSEKTRSVITSSFTSMIDVLNRGVLRDLFCKETTLTPDAIEQGKIILVCMPVKEFGEAGLFAQILWKYAFQKSIERRDLSKSDRPVFLWADEAQNFLTSYDMEFLTTCRAARVATVFLTQNYSNFVAALGGGEKSRVETDSILANLNIKILHANGDPVTNEWASGLIGRSLEFFINGGTSRPSIDQTPMFQLMLGLQSDATESTGFSTSYEFEVQPKEFTQLRTGGPDNKMIVEGIVFQNGKTFTATDKTWMQVRFNQKI